MTGDEKLTKLVADVFNMSPDGLGPEMTPDDIPQWDSLNHLRLITALESEFQIKLNMQQIQQINCLRDIQNIVDSGS